MFMKRNIVFFYTMVSILIVLGNVYSFEDDDDDDDDGFAGCYCSIFKRGARPPNNDPIIEESAKMEMERSDAGREDCARLCIVLAEDGDHAPETLCEAYKKDVDNLKISLYYRLEKEPWTCIGPQTIDPVCCRNSKAIHCKTSD